MKAVIMAGGEGSRLRPLTCNRPKPMVPVANKPVMEHIVELLRIHGFTDINVTLQFLPGVIQDYFGDGSRFGVRLRYYVEDQPLGTAGSVRNVGEQLKDTFLVVSGDALTDIDLTALVDFHRRSGAIATLALARCEAPLEYGVVITDRDGRITRFLEKPGWGEVFSDAINTGIYVLEPEALGSVEPGRSFDFSRDLFPLLLRMGEPLFGYLAPGYWCDIGNISQYLQAQLDVLSGKLKVAPRGDLVGDNIWMGKGVELEPGASISGPAVIGDGCRLAREARLDGYNVLGIEDYLGPGARLKRSVLWDRVYLAPGVQIRGALICDRVKLGRGSEIYEGAVVGDDCSAGRRTILKPGVKVWPNKNLDGGTTHTCSLVWGSGGIRSVFASDSIRGELNVDITPELVARAAASFGGRCPRGSKVLVACDHAKPSRMLKLSAMSGLVSAGCDAVDTGSLPPAVLRYAVPVLGGSGGIYISMPGDRMEIGFLDERGVYLSRDEMRKLEGSAEREEIRRTGPEAIGDVRYEGTVIDSYLEWIGAHVDSRGIRNRRFRIALQSDRREVVLFLERLGCEVLLPGAGCDMSETVRQSGADLGAIPDDALERLTLYDERGSRLSVPCRDMLLVLLELESRGRELYVPVTAPRETETLAAMYGASVRRLKSERGELLRAYLLKSPAPPVYCPPLDAVAALGSLLDYLARAAVQLSGVMSALPHSHVSVRSTYCPWHKKGAVMRRLIQETPVATEMIDGIGFRSQGGWTLVLPDADEPAYHVYGEAASWEVAENLADFEVKRLTTYIQA